MADQLATQADLETFLETTFTSARATLLLECATAVVQAAAGQRIVQVTETVTLDGSPGSWLNLPEIPVSAVSSVKLDGATIAAGAASSQYKRRAARLYRSDGWQASRWAPSEVEVGYTHGYPSGHQALQLARATCLSLASQVQSNPTGVQSERIDDYAVTYTQMEAVLATAPHLVTALVRKYGRRAGLVKIGG